MRLEVNDLKKSFGEKEVLKGISFSVESGQTLGLLGRNGAGKTTTIRMIMDVFPMDEGTVTVDGVGISQQNLSIGYLPEERGLYPKKKIKDQLLYFAMLHGMSKKDGLSAVDFWLRRLSMEEYKEKRLDTLSKGNQQKIQLITALIHDPDIVILDEPFSGLDPVNAQLLKDIVNEQIQAGKLVIFSSHQMNYIEEFCERIVILNRGEIAVGGLLREIRRSYRRDKLVIRSPHCEKIRQEYGDACRISERDENEALLTMKEEADKQVVMRHLAENYDIDEIRVYEPTLNDIFVEFTKDDAAKEA